VRHSQPVGLDLDISRSEREALQLAQARNQRRRRVVLVDERMAP
jgi:hypothetical protein